MSNGIAFGGFTKVCRDGELRKEDTPVAEHISKRNIIILESISRSRMRICGLGSLIMFATVIAISNSCCFGL